MAGRIVELIRNSAEFQKAVHSAPEEERDRVIQLNEQLAERLDEVVLALEALLDDPERLRAFQEDLERRLRNREVSGGS